MSITTEKSVHRPFSAIVGQNAAKSQYKFFLDVHRSGGIIPTTMIIAPKGCGKTSMAEEMGRSLKAQSGGTKQWWLINCSSIKSLDQFVNEFLIKCVVDKEGTYIFDEASEIPRSVAFALLTMLNPNKHNRNSYTHQEYTIDIDFSKHTFIFATSEPHKVQSALLDRCQPRIELEEYTLDDIGEIILMQQPEIETDTLMAIASSCRGNARSAVSRAKAVGQYMSAKSRKIFGSSDWNELSSIFGILPLGLSNIELRVLRSLAERPEGTSLTRLAAITGMTQDSLRRDLEMYLLHMDFISIETSGRNITALGLEYLKKIGSPSISRHVVG